MLNEDRKLTWSAVVVLAVVALEFAWFLLVGPSNHSANQAAQQEAKGLFLGLAAEDWTAVFTGVLTFSTIGLWLQTKRLAEGADKQSGQMEASIAVANAANKISETGQRAWIAIESVKLISPTAIPNLDLVQNPYDENARRTRLVIQVETRNIGHTPASQLKISCKILEPTCRELQPYVRDHLQSSGLYEIRGEGGSVVLPGDREYRTFEFWGPLPRECFPDWPDATFVFAVDVCATYRISTDIDVHKTQFSYRDAVEWRAPVVEIGLTRDGNREGSPT